MLTEVYRATALIMIALILASCGEVERREMRLTPTATAEVGVRVIVDNCPGPSRLSLLIREEVIWEIEAILPDSTVDNAAEESADSDPNAGDSNDATAALREFQIGEAPEGWQTITPLESQLEAGIRYTVRTEPDEQSVDFSTPDLRSGLLFNGNGNRQFNDDLISEECAEPADIGRFASNIAVLGALWVTAAALVLVALIALLFVITRRFSRVSSIQRRRP